MSGGEVALYDAAEATRQRLRAIEEATGKRFGDAYLVMACVQDAFSAYRAHTPTTPPAAASEVVREREQWESCNCAEPPFDDEVFHDRNGSPRCPRCNVALGGDPMTASERAEHEADDRLASLCPAQPEVEREDDLQIAKTIRRQTMVELLEAVYLNHGWPITLGRMAGRANELYEITADPSRNRYVVTPRQALATPTAAHNAEALRETLGERVMVPREPSHAMLIAGCCIPGVSLGTGKRMWAAMIAASPARSALDSAEVKS